MYPPLAPSGARRNLTQAADSSSCSDSHKSACLQKRGAQIAIFWDYDTLWGTDTDRNLGYDRKSGEREFENTERLLELHEKYQVRACFAIVGAAAAPGERPYHDPAQVRRIHAAGHEIASHSFQHEWLPGLDSQRLRETLQCSKDALEQCIGAPVVTFVPPYNQPFDYSARFAISLSERWHCRGVRTDLSSMCAVLGETGYRVCRISYTPAPVLLAEKLFKRRFDPRGQVEWIRGIVCLRLNTPCGFGNATVAALQNYARRGRLAVVYGHPHSLTSYGPQNATVFDPFLAAVAHLRRTGILQVVTPAEIAELATT
jgi:peptidoglycan/xylan/chitin deacetylase (PgdA/CDA1 family)